MRKKGIAVTPSLNQVDHLVPICDLLDIPLIVASRRVSDLCQQYYPALHVQVVEDRESECLKDYQVIVHSTRVPRLTIDRLGFSRDVRFINCPHGWSDKRTFLKWMALEDVFFSYGDATFRMFEEEDTLQYVNRAVLLGDFRYAHYLKHKAAFDKAVEPILATLDESRETILYAPTWADPQGSSSFFTSCAALVDRLPAKYNLLVKLHDWLVHFRPEEVRAMMATLTQPGRVTFVIDCPLVFPLLAHSRIYVGDRSSVGYDFLAFDRPMFFLRPPGGVQDTSQSLPGTCGLEIEEADLPRLFDLIETALPSDGETFSVPRRAMWSRMFAPHPSEDSIRAAVGKAVEDDRLPDEALPPAYLDWVRKAVDHVMASGGPNPPAWLQIHGVQFLKFELAAHLAGAPP